MSAEKRAGENSAATGRDSMGKALRRGLDPRRWGPLLRRAFTTLRRRGWQALGRELAFRLNLARHRPVWRYRADMPLRKTLRAQRRRQPSPAPLVSVVVPLYNTPLAYLQQMMDSVRAQTYQNWELVLADGSDADHAEVGRALKAAAKKDARVRYIKLDENRGIAGNTNAAIAISHGEWLALLDHDDVLQPNALYEIMAAANATGAQLVYSDEVVLDESLENLGEFHFKGDYGPDTLRGCNTVTHLCAFSKALLQAAGGGPRAEFDGAQDYDLVLRLAEAAGAERICHIPRVLYFWRRHGGSTAGGIAQKPQATAAGVAAVQAQLGRLRLKGTAEAQEGHPGAVRVRYAVEGAPLVSVLIPSCDHVDDLARCLESLYAKGGWENLEVLVLDNNSADDATPAYYEAAQKQYPGLKVLHWPGAFNFSAINNFGAQAAAGAHLLLLNNDVEVTSEGFVAELLAYSQRPEVGAVGAKLLYPDGTVQHAGLIVGIGGTAGVSHKGHDGGDGGDMFRLCTSQNVSAVTGAALMVKRDVYIRDGGLDADNFAVAFNDVDFCLRLREKGLWNVFTPFALATHYESKSRGYDTEGEKKARFEAEAAAFKKRWAGLLEKGDPFYNPHFTLKTENFAYR